jgi:pimeloyl-ACP methyl ester carboxylesterase
MLTAPDNTSLYRSAAGYRAVMVHFDAALEEMGIPFHVTYVDTGFGPTHVVICGAEDGKPLVLWHGLNASSTTWTQWIPALAPTYRLYAIDTIGGLGRSAASRPPRRGPAYGRWMAEVLPGLGLERANMPGASNGSWLIGKLASVAPDRIGSAVLMSAAGVTRLQVGHALRMLPRLLFKPPADVARQTWASLSPPDVPPDPVLLELLELITRHYRGEPMPTLLRDAELRRLTAPAFLLMGQYEVLVNPYATIQRASRLLPNLVRAEVVPGVGHAMVHQQPDWVRRRVMDFLERHAV